MGFVRGRGSDLDRQEIIRKVQNLRFPKMEYWICTGAGLVLHGIKEETRDIDIGCTSMLADELICKGAKWGHMQDGTRKIQLDGDIEVFENWLVDEVVEVEGLRVASIESIRKQKALLNREKDWGDIRLIDQFVRRP